VIVLDANILIYAWNKGDEHHPNAKEWLERTFADESLVGIPWPTIWAFLRLTTNARVFPKPLAPDISFEIVHRWLQLPNVLILQSGHRHLELHRALVVQGQAAGPLVSDAVLAAITIEPNGTLASTDRDFSRFAGLAWIDPLAK